MSDWSGFERVVSGAIYDEHRREQITFHQAGATFTAASFDVSKPFPISRCMRLVIAGVERLAITWTEHEKDPDISYLVDYGERAPLSEYWVLKWRDKDDWGWLMSLDGNQECTSRDVHRRLRYGSKAAVMAALWKFRRDNYEFPCETIRVVRVRVKGRNPP